MSLKIVFAGTPDFAVPSLHALSQCHDICAIYTKPDKPAGRGLNLTYSPVKEYALKHYDQIPILQPITLKDAEIQRQLADFQADLMIVIAYGLILPKEVLALFKHGCINVHASLLPRWRGAAPIQRAILAGDKQSGVTIMQIDEGLDTGAMWRKSVHDITPQETSNTLHDALAELGAESLIATMGDIERGTIEPEPQNNALATYAAKITKEEGLINWQESADQIDRQIRAFNPWPGAYTYLNGNLLKVWEAELVDAKSLKALPGTVVAVTQVALEIATSQGVISLHKIQLAGGRPLLVKDFLNARRNEIAPLKTILGQGNVNNS